MTLTTTLTGILVQTLANIISNLAWFFLIVWGVRVISREIGKGIKQVPVWIDQYEQGKLKRFAIERAQGRR